MRIMKKKFYITAIKINIIRHIELEMSEPCVKVNDCVAVRKILFFNLKYCKKVSNVNGFCLILSFEGHIALL